MKKIPLLLALLGLMASCTSAQSQNIKLNEPNKDRGYAITKALDLRKSTREYADRELSQQDLSDLLWAANGLNRPDKRTAGTAMNSQEMDVYVCMKGGAYRYDPQNHELVHVTSEDVRGYFANGQEYMTAAPVCLLIVSDATKMKGGDTEDGRMYMAYDAGIISQNISLFCSGCEFATVTRGIMNKRRLTEALGLSANHLLHLNHPVGYFK